MTTTIEAPTGTPVAAPDTGIRAGKTMGPCSYCGRVYDSDNGAYHFIPCNTCDSLEHAGCQH